MLNRIEIQNITPEFLSLIKMPEKNIKGLNYLMVLPMRVNPTHNNHFTIGLPSICSALKASGRNVFTLNLAYKLNPLELLKHSIEANSIDVVMSGGFAVQYKEIKKIIDEAKRVKPDIITVVGGYIITGDPIAGMTALENADYGVMGEGEITVNTLAYALETKSNAEDVEGVICMRDGEWSVRDNWTIVPDVDILPFPDYEGFEYSLFLEMKNRFMSGSNTVNQKSLTIREFYSITEIMFNRSCPNRCTFCFHSKQDRVRKMSVGIMKKYLDWLLSLYPIDSLLFCDELAMSDNESAMEFCQFIKPYGLRWITSAKADCINRDTIQAMKDSGCFYIGIGIESADNRILKSMNKNILIKQVEERIIDTEKSELFLQGGIIIGDPEETTETMLRSIEWFIKHRNNKYLLISIGIVQAYPGTQIYKNAVKNGIINDPVQYLKDGCPPVNITKLTDDEYYVLPAVYRSLGRNMESDDKLDNSEINPLSDYTVNLSGRCRCCKNIVSFAHQLLFDIARKPCPVCGEPVNVNAIEYCDFENLNKKAIGFISGGKAAVWGINLVNFFWLIRAIPCLKEDNVYFVNKDKLRVPDNGRYIKTLHKKEVFTPGIIETDGIDTIIVPNNPAVFHEIKKQCAWDFGETKNVIHVTELL